MVKEAWCKVGNKTLGPLRSVRAKGKRWDRLFESGVPKLISKCDLESTTLGNGFGTFEKVHDFLSLFFDFI